MLPISNQPQPPAGSTIREPRSGNHLLSTDSLSPCDAQPGLKLTEKASLPHSRCCKESWESVAAVALVVLAASKSGITNGLILKLDRVAQLFSHGLYSSSFIFATLAIQCILLGPHTRHSSLSQPTSRLAKLDYFADGLAELNSVRHQLA